MTLVLIFVQKIVSMCFNLPSQLKCIINDLSINNSLIYYKILRVLQVISHIFCPDNPCFSHMLYQGHVLDIKLQ